MGNLIGKDQNYKNFKQTMKDVKEEIQKNLEKIQKTRENSKNNQSSPYIQTFKEIMKYDKNLRALGCFFGAIIGDALGAYCQFTKGQISNNILIQTMQMKEGGVFNLYQGQFTDDSQLAFHLLKGLCSLSSQIKLNAQQYKILLNISKQYIDWKNSAPFDIGITCHKGIQAIQKNIGQNIQKIQEKQANQIIRNILKKVNEVNSKSQSNGSLMRIAPMACFFSFINESPQNFRQFIQCEIALIHSNQVLKEAGYIWVKILYDLINRPDDDQNTFKRIYQDAENMTKNTEVKKWFKKSKDSNKVSATENMGWAKIAWTYGMNLLYCRSSQTNQLKYYDQIKSVIKNGGDSDTNAGIVGGLIGAIIGFKQLPPHYLLKMFKLKFPDLRSQIRDRPKQYQPFNLLVQFFDLFEACKKYNNNNQHI